MNNTHSSQVSGILFDVYNTLISREKSDFDKLVELLPAGIPSPDPGLIQSARSAVMEYYKKERHLSWAIENNLTFWKKFYELYLQELEVTDSDHSVAHSLAGWSRDPNSFVITPDALYVLKTLQDRGYRVGLLSNWDVTLATFCEQLGLASSVDMILASDEMGIRKPAPEIFKEGCRRLGVEVPQGLYIGDSLPKDIAGGNKAGMFTVWFDRHCQTPSSFSAGEEPAVTIHHLSEVLAYLPGAPLFQI